MESDRFWYAHALFDRYGAVKRARGQYLYTQSGVRLVDMYMEGGRAALGWRTGKALTVCKNTLNRGVVGSFITAEQHRLVRAVQNLLPGYEDVRWYCGVDSCESVLRICTASGAVMWRPWEIQCTEKSDLIYLVPPFPWAGEILIVASRSMRLTEVLPYSDMIAPPVLAGMARALYDLLAEIPQRNESMWRVHDKILLKYWKRSGPYLYPVVPEDDYSRFFLHCLDCGLFISPVFTSASVVPHEVASGDFTQLKKRAYESE